LDFGLDKPAGDRNGNSSDGETEIFLVFGRAEKAALHRNDAYVFFGI